MKKKKLKNLSLNKLKIAQMNNLERTKGGIGAETLVECALESLEAANACPSAVGCVSGVALLCKTGGGGNGVICG